MFACRLSVWRRYFVALPALMIIASASPLAAVEEKGWSLVPSAKIGAQAFRVVNPDYDGRG